MVCLGQGGSSAFTRPTPTALSSDYTIDQRVLRDRLLSRIPEEIRTGIYARESLQYCDFSARRSSYSLYSGQVYTDWKEMEEYLEAVLDKVVPSEILDRLHIRPVLTKGGRFNASIDASGIMMLNIGVWGHLDSEAALASIMAHEVAHAYFHHSFESYMREVKETYDLGILADGRPVRYRDSRTQETEADSLAHIWIQASDYSEDGMHELLRILQRQENRSNRMSSDGVVLVETTHPLSDERLELMKRFREQSDLSGEMYLISEDRFNSLKEQAIPEILEELLWASDYDYQIEMAFKYHLFSPDDPMPIYYLMEGIRRKIYLEEDIIHKNFITSEYYDIFTKEGVEYSRRMTNGLFDRFDTRVLSMSPPEYRRIDARFYWDENVDVKFNTYAEAFLFFAQVGEALGCTECDLSEALFHSDDPVVHRANLTEYLEGESPDHDVLARELLASGHPYDRPEKKLTVFDRGFFFVRQGQEDIPLDVENSSGESSLSAVLDSVVSTFEDRRFIYLPSLKDTDYEEYNLLKEAKSFARRRTRGYRYSDKKIELHLIEPQIADLFLRHDVSEVEFVDLRYFEFKKKSFSVDKYYEDLERSFDDILQSTKLSRYLALRFATLRSSPDDRQVFSFQRRESPMKFKQTSKEGLALFTISEFWAKDSRLKNILESDESDR